MALLRDISFALTLLAAAAWLGGCQTAPTPIEASAASRPEPAGMEVSWWIVDDAPASPTSTPIRELLAPFASRSVPVDWRTLEAWRGCGLRVVTVPLAELDGLRGALHFVGPLQNQWLGEAVRPVEIARGPDITRPTTLTLDNGDIVLSDGDLRLMLRCWAGPSRVTPESGPGANIPAALQLELVPRHEPAEARSEFHGLALDAPRTPLVFSRLTLEAALLGDEAIVLIAERPDVDWSRPAPEGVEPTVPFLGPSIPASLTLGEALLGGANTVQGRRTRAILVLAPSVPRVFRLLSRAAE